LPSPEGAVTTDKVQVFYDELNDILMKMDQTVNVLRVSLEKQASKGQTINK
jgi:predicted transcriptional regulator